MPIALNVLCRPCRRGVVSGVSTRLASAAGLTGLGLVVFAVIALSAPGRIDVVDGYTRYDVGRSFVEHGDSLIRDPNVWFAVLPGRNGDRYTNYRFPHSAVAAAAILVADATGPSDETRRHFFFSLSGAVLGAATAMLYAFWFRRVGHGDLSSLAWAAGGVFCTPTWFYATTTFDDTLGSLAVLAAVVAPLTPIGRWPIATAAASGLLLALAFNCKPPLALFTPLALATLRDSPPASDERWKQPRVVFVNLALGILAYKIYDLWKFPPNTWAQLSEVQGTFAAPWPGNTLAGLLSLLVSPGMGMFWYWPALIIALHGLTRWRDGGGQRWLARSAGLSSAAFLLFVSSIRFFSGEPAWGPRYLTPMFALLWIFVPVGAARLGAKRSVALLTLSFAIQIAGLSVDTMRFFSGVKESTASRFLVEPWLYFEFDSSQLLAQPRQMLEILTYDGPAAQSFSPAAKPTLPWYVFVVEPGGEPPDLRRARRTPAPRGIDLSNPVERVREYQRSRKPLDSATSQVINSFRPWWVAYRYLPPSKRPVDLNRTTALLLLTAAAGLMLIARRQSQSWPRGV